MDFNSKCHAVIKGWDALNRYCERRWKERPRFLENFARIDGECYIRKLEAKAPTDQYWTKYFLLALPNQFGRIIFPDEHEVYECINNGTIKPLNVT